MKRGDIIHVSGNQYRFIESYIGYMPYNVSVTKTKHLAVTKFLVERVTDGAIVSIMPEDIELIEPKI